MNPRRNGVVRVVVFVAATSMLFLSAYKNVLGVAPGEFFRRFQSDSESLVLGRFVANDIGRELPKGAGIGHASAERYAGLPFDVAYWLIANRNLPDRELVVERLDTKEWLNGVGREFAAVAVKVDRGIGDYVGKWLDVDGQRRIVTGVVQSGHLSLIHLSGDALRGVGPGTTMRLIGAAVPASEIVLAPYESQVGIQGWFFVTAGRLFGRESRLSRLYLVNCLLFALLIVTLTFLYRRIVSGEFAAIFFVSVLLSPWLTVFARNLFWVPFTWFLPPVIACAYYLERERRRRLGWLVALYLAFLIKCLAGYEYVSAIILFAAAVFLIEAFRPDARLGRRECLRDYAVVCAAGALAFATALLIHAGIRGETVWDGLRAIYELDVKRRTYGDPGKFDPVYHSSLTVSPLSVVRSYVVNWRTQFVWGVSGSIFAVLCLGSAISIIVRGFAKHPNARRDAAVCLAFVLPPVSWYVLAKAHSHLHPHLSFVLWYLGFAAAIIYVSSIGLRMGIIGLVAWAKTAKARDL